MDEAPPIIGICGGIGCGKDTLADVLCQLFPRARTAKFADALRRAVSALTGTPADRMCDTAGKAAPVRFADRDEMIRRAESIPELAALAGPADLVDFFAATCAGVSVGRALQIVGTEFFRRRDPDVWVRALFADTLHGHAVGAPVVISDVRFANEAAAIRARGGVIIEVRRAVDGSALAGRDPSHESELLAPGTADFVLHNNASVADLAAAAARLPLKKHRAAAAIARIRETAIPTARPAGAAVSRT